MHLDQFLRSEAWGKLLCQEFEASYMQALTAFLDERRASGETIYPPMEQVFSALNITPPHRVRVVILGQDPYHNPGQAQGLAFSVRRETPIPPSLGNIYRELHDDLGIDIPEHGCLKAWGERGVLLINDVLTVAKQQPGSHQGKGWEQFTDAIIRSLTQADRPLVFMLWGAHAQKKGRHIDSRRHCVLRAPHPSPLSAYRGFFGCGHFSKANAFLKAQGDAPIDWSL